MSMFKLSQYGFGLISIMVPYELVPPSILRPYCHKLKKSGVLVQRSPNDCFAGSKGFPGVLAAAVPRGGSLGLQQSRLHEEAGYTIFKVPGWRTLSLRAVVANSLVPSKSVS